MPIKKYSAMDPSGTFRSDAMDQVEQWNANRGDQWNQFALNLQNQNKQDDWRREVALQQIAQGDRFYQGNREESALERAARAEAEKQKYGYMTGRDAIGDQRWQQTWEQDKLDREDERNWRQAQTLREQTEYDARKPLQNAQLEMTLAQLARMKQEQQNMANASGAAVYTPSTDAGREAYQSTLAMTGNQLQASQAAKAAERAKSGEKAEVAKRQLASTLEDFRARDAAMIGFDPTAEDTGAVSAQADALIGVLKDAGFDEQTARTMVAELMREKLTSGGRTDWNQGPSEQLIRKYGGSYR